jgi:D-galactarolactone cycloisomerase
VRIADVRTVLISEALDEPWQMGLGTAHKRDEVLVRVRTDEGLEGIGASYHAHTPHAIKAIIDSKLAPIVTGESPLQIQALWERMFFGTIHLGGGAAQAIAGIDIALWDLLGKITGQPVYRLLGGGEPVTERNPEGAPRLTAYVGCQTLGIRDDLDSLVAEAEAYVAEGFRAVKLRGGAGVRADLAAVAAVRDRVGDDIDIMVDANARYSWPEAVRLAKGLEAYDTAWLEDPFDFTVAYHRDDIGRLRQQSTTPIASGGNVHTRFDMRDLVDKGGVDYLTPDVVKSAGISESLKIAALASANSIVVATHTYNGLTQVANLHFAAAIPEHVRGYVEWDANAVNAFRDELVAPTVDVTDGVLTVPSGPGLGVELDPEALDRLEFIEGPEILGVPRRRSWAPGG